MVGARIEVAEPAPEPASVLERRELPGLRHPQSLGRELTEDVEMLHRVDAGRGGFRSPGGVLVHEDGQASRVSAGAGPARRLGPRRDV